jgi:glycosyltransferase involved in cell wall biosynthesis
VPSLDRITPLILTFNEEPNLQRVLQQLVWAERIVIVDSFSMDGTLAIARSYPQVEVLQRPFDSFADQCNFGLAHVQTEWVLSLDADYVCNRELFAEVAALPAHPAENGFAVRFRYCVAGRPLRASLYPPRTVLYRREHARYRNDGHAHRVEISGGIGKLSHPIDHDDRKPLTAWLRAQERYASEEAVKLRRTPPGELGRADRLRRRVWLAPALAPIYCLLAKGLLWEGPAGWYYTLQRTYAEVLLSLELAEQRLSDRA